MKNITIIGNPEDIPEILRGGKYRLWQEDDATMHQHDHEGVRQAWVRILGCERPKLAECLHQINCGDSGYDLYPGNLVHVWACDGDSIHHIRDLIDLPATGCAKCDRGDGQLGHSDNCKNR